VTPAGRAPDLAILRRLSLALAGRTPSLREIRAFEAQPESGRLARWVDGLLRDRRFADYWAERLARAFVGTEDGPFLVFRRRRFVSWLSDELLRGRPYDQVVRALIADEGLWTDQPATNFVTVTYDKEAKRPDAERLAARVSRAFLGARLDCAQCHDHPFQPWKRRDFQGLAAFFGQVNSGLTGIRDGTGDYQVTNRKTNTPETIAPGVPFLPELLPRDGSRRGQLARWVTDPRNPNLARATVNRAWALLFGRPLVEPVDDLAGAGDPPRVLELLADDFVAHGYDLRRLIAAIAATEAFRLDSAVEPELTGAHEELWAAFPLTRLPPEQAAGGLLQAASLETIDRQSPILVRLATASGQSQFLRRHGDMGEDEFDARAGTIPQRLLMMNGDLVREKTKEDLANAATRIGWLAPSDRAAVEVAYLTVLTRRPSPEEAVHFAARLGGTRSKERGRHMTTCSGRSSTPRSSHGTTDGQRPASARSAGILEGGRPGGPELADAGRPPAGRAGRARPQRRRGRSSCCGWPGARASWRRSTRTPARPRPGGPGPSHRRQGAATGRRVRTAGRGHAVGRPGALPGQQGGGPRARDVPDEDRLPPRHDGRAPVHRRHLLPRAARRTRRDPPARLDPAGPVAGPGRLPGRRVRRLPGRRPVADAARRRPARPPRPRRAARPGPRRRRARLRPGRRGRVAATLHRETLERARVMMTSAQLAAFDIAREPAALRAEYGDTPSAAPAWRPGA
jgi:hypothetical protein